MITGQHHIEFNGWFDEMRLAFFKVVEANNHTEKQEHHKQFRRAFRKLDELAKEIKR